MPPGQQSAEPRNWIVEAIAALAAAVVIGVWAFQTLYGESADTEVTLLFVAIAGSAVVFLFGIDRLREWFDLVRK